MWVSGSLIRSSTWRSSSVSAPCISSSISLPSSAERSRTMRGSFCQALPIGCMRVFMTPSCSSAVTLESRCSGTLNSESSCRRTISSSWLRVSTSSETMVIRCSSVSTLTRIDWLATLRRPVFVVVRRRLRSALAGFGFGCGRLRRSPDPCGFAERALQFVERNFAGTQRPLQRLRRPACRRVAPALPRGATAACIAIRSSSRDQVGVGAFRLALVLLELVENFLDAVDGGRGSA